MAPNLGPTPLAAQEEPEDWQEELARMRQEREVEEQRLRQQQLGQELHQQYVQLVEQFLKDEGRPQPAAGWADLLDDIDDVTQQYRMHPGLVQPANISHERLADLYWLRNTLHDMVESLAGQGLFGQKSGAFEMGKKRRNRLRLHLIE